MNYNLSEEVRNNSNFLSTILEELGFEKPQKKKLFSKYSKHFPLFNFQYPFWSILDGIIRLSFWGLAWLFFEHILGLKEAVYIFLSFITGQIIFFVLVSLLFKTNKI